MQLRNELEFGEQRLGIAAGIFFVSAMVSTAALSRLGERLGPTNGLRIGLVVTAGAELWLAAGARSWAALLPPLLLAGVANSMTQPTANLFLSRTFDSGQLGIATAVKQSGMPASALLGGLTVPAIALTVGWEWVYVAGAGYALLAAIVLPVTPHTTSVRTRAARANTSTRALTLVAAGISMGVFGAASLTSWVVSSGEAAGMAPGAAALLLSIGSALGIVVRLVSGRWSDRSAVHPLRVVSLMLGIGALGLLPLAIGDQWLHAIAIVPAFGAGWAWPGLFNLAIIRANPNAPGAATGITQTGIYIGSFSAPIIFGVVVNAAGYGTAWLLAAAVAALGAFLIWRAQYLQPAQSPAAPLR